MQAGSHWREFLAEGRKNIYGRVWDAIIAGGTVLALWLGKVAWPLALLLGVIVALVLWQRRETRRIKETTRMLTGITLTAEDVLNEAAEADKFAAAAEEGFRHAAQRRLIEAEYVAKHGQRDSVATGTYSDTFEHVASEQAQAWKGRFDVLATKLTALGFKVVVPSKPQKEIEGEPTVAATKLVCEREAFEAATDALRHANESIASDVHPTTAGPQSS